MATGWPTLAILRSRQELAMNQPNMNQPKPNDLMDLLADFCLQCEDPLAMIDGNGRLVQTNAPMREILRRLPDGEVQLLAMGAADAPRTRAVKWGSQPGKAKQLLRLPLGQLTLITLIRQDEDPRIERLRQKLDEAQKQSITDPLTGIWNRLQFQQLSKIELARSERHRQPLCLLVVDIDHFKLINDTHGHSAGDQVLRDLTEVMRQQIRLVDSLFRWGGEEFVVLLPNTAMTAARMIAERLRKGIEQHAFQIGQITVSIGLAQGQAGESAEAFFARADDALYQAKASGRNRVVCAELDAAQDQTGSDAPLFMPWKAEYESGHPLIDSQHQKLFELGNALIGASLDPNTESKTFLDMTDALIEHVGKHFADEESILESMDYGNLAQHQRAHQMLLAKALDMRQRAADARISTGEVLDFLVNSVVRQHMMTADRAFFSELPGTPGHR